MDPAKTPLPQQIAALAPSKATGAQDAEQSIDWKAQAQEIAEEFEALFLSQMMAPMFESLQTDGPFGGGSSEGMYRSLMVEEYGKAIAQSGGVGIAEAVQREILKIQEIDS